MATAASTQPRVVYPLTRRARIDHAHLVEEDPQPICVDLDGTLLRTDLLLETFLAAVRQNPLVLVLAPYWLLRDGKAALKAKLAGLVKLNPALLPYHEPLIAFLR